MPKVSIIIPCYGVEKYLDRCMDAVLNQSLRDVEIILVDDGSQDRVPEMCDRYALKDSRVKVVHKSNGGLGFARNSGLEIASGEYVAFVDSDDFIEREMYQKLVDYADENNLDACFCGFKIERASGKWIKSSEVDENVILQGGEVISFMLDMIASSPDVSKERGYYMSVWHSIYRRSIIFNHHLLFESERNVGSEDIPFQIDFLKLSQRIGYITDCLYYYCLNGSSLTATFKADKFSKYINLYNLIKSKVDDLEGGNVRCARLLSGYARTELLQLIDSKYDDPKEYFNKISSDPVWLEISRIYPPYCVRDQYQRLFYQLIISKNSTLLYLFLRVISSLRKVKYRLK